MGNKTQREEKRDHRIVRDRDIKWSMIRLDEQSDNLFLCGRWIRGESSELPKTIILWVRRTKTKVEINFLTTLLLALCQSNNVKYQRHQRPVNCSNKLEKFAIFMLTDKHCKNYVTMRADVCVWHIALHRTANGRPLSQLSHTRPSTR